MTVYAFAIDNFNRPEDEVDTIMKLAEERLVEMAEHGYARFFFLSPRCSFTSTWQSEILDRHGVRLNVLGRRELLPERVQLAVAKAESMTRTSYLRSWNLTARYVRHTRRKTRSRQPSKQSFKMLSTPAT